MPESPESPESPEWRTEPRAPKSAGSRFVKVSRRVDDDARMQREAALLRALRHPGIVTFITADTTAFPNVLVTERVDGPSLAEAGPLPAAEVERLVTEVGATLTDLHRVGLVHGAIAPEHILVGPDGRPVLCSFGYAGRIGDPATPLPPALAEFADPRGAGAELTPDLDLHALAVVRRSLLAPPPAVPGAPPAPDPPLRPPAPDHGRRRRAALLVAAPGGAALLVAVAIWGLTGRSETDPPGSRAAFTTTVPAPSVPPRRPDPTNPRGDVGMAPPGTTSEASPDGEAPSSARATGGAEGPGFRGPIDPSRSSLPVALGGGAPEAVVELSADGEPCPSEMATGTAPPTSTTAARGPAPSGGPPVARATPPTGPAAASAAQSRPAPQPLSSTPPPPLSPPGASSLSPQVSVPPPESLPPGVTLPDPASLAPPPVELPDVSTLVPPPAPVP